MSSDDRGKTRASRAGRLAGAMLLALGTVAAGGCGDAGFRPLYGALGSQASEKLKQVDFAPIPGRVGQRIRNEMIFQTTGGGEAGVPTYRLEVVLNESLVSTLVRATGEAEGQVYSVEAAFRLID